jgi:hypothetical protein
VFQLEEADCRQVPSTSPPREQGRAGPDSCSECRLPVRRRRGRLPPVCTGEVSLQGQGTLLQAAALARTEWGDTGPALGSYKAVLWGDTGPACLACSHSEQPSPVELITLDVAGDLERICTETQGLGV